MPDLLDYPSPDYNPSEPPRWGNVYHSADDGRIVQVRGTRTTALRTVSLSWERMGLILATFIEALDALKAGQSDCYFYTPNIWRWWSNASAGVGDGAALNFPFGGTDLQSSIKAPVVKLDGVVQTLWYTVEAIPGDSLKRWRVAFTAGHAPGAGVVVTVSFMGRRLLLGKIIQDEDEATPKFGKVALSVVLQGEEV